LLNVARLTDQKAQWVLVEAASHLKERNINAHISIIGEGPLYDELQKTITERELENQISLLQFQSNIDSFLVAADAFVLTSIDEGMPMALLEAAALGTPIITTLVGDIHKLVSADDSGLVIPTNNPAALIDAIVRLEASPELIESLTQNVHKKMLTLYSSKAMRLSYVELYRSVLTTH
jgi:glycosyltransferase involved in cell wall biosynthesis